MSTTPAAGAIAAYTLLADTPSAEHKPQPTVPEPASAVTANGKPFVSAGKRIHNEITYRGVDWLLNSAIGVAFTYWTSRTESGKKIVGERLTGFWRRMLKPILKSEKSLEIGASWGTRISTIILGGTLIIWPMIQLEKKKNKKAIMRWADEKYYGEEMVKNDPRFEQQYRAIDEEPKKNFATGMLARIIVLVPMFAVTMWPDANKLMVKYLYNPIAKGSKSLCESLGIRPKKLMERGVVEIVDSDVSAAPRFHSDWDFIHQTTGLDLGLTFIYSYAHEAVIKTLAALGLKQTENGAAKPDETDSLLPPILPPSAFDDVAASEAYEPPASLKAAWSEKHSKTTSEIIPSGSHRETLSRSAAEPNFAVAP